MQFFEIRSRTTRRVFAGNVAVAVVCATALSAAEGRPMSTHTYKRVGDLEIKADVHYPSGTGLSPVVVWIHGGALITGHRAGVDARARKMMLDAGYAIVSIDYRLAPETKLPAILEDVQDAFVWLRREGKGLGLETARIAVMGGSAGGYLTLATGYRVQPRPTVLVSFWGYGDLIGDWYSKPSPHERHRRSQLSETEAYRQVSGPPVSDARERKGDGGAFYQFCRQRGIWPTAVSGWSVEREAEKFRAYMPVMNVTPEFPPTLLIHGTVDTDVPFEQSTLMAARMKEQGVTHELIAIEDGEHGLTGGDPARIEAAYRAALAFVERTMRGDSADIAVSTVRETIVQIAQWLRQIRLEKSIPGSTHLPRYLAASDVHGNAARLHEMLATADRENISHIYLVGDLYAGLGGWSAYRMLQARVPAEDAQQGMTLMWGNHELAFVAGMRGNDRQLRFSYSYGLRALLDGMNAERQSRGETPLILSGAQRLSAADLAQIRAQPELREMASWIQQTHRLFATDAYGTGYLHAFPSINRQGHFVFEYRGQRGLAALPDMERDLREAVRSDHPVFSVLLRTETSPVWALFEITSARQFDQAIRSCGVRQIVFGHRHHTDAVNVGHLNRQIGIAVDFDQGLGGYAVIGPDGIVFRRFTDRDSMRTSDRELIAPSGGLSARDSHVNDIAEFLFRQLVRLEQGQFDAWPAQSQTARHEFEFLQGLHEQGYPWIHRLFAELYTHVKDTDLRTDMFATAVASGDEEAFRSFIHLLHQKSIELENHRTDWYSEPYRLAKSVVQVLMRALGEMPLARLGLLDTRLRGMTSRFNLTELYKRILQLEDPELALFAVQNLGTLKIPEANQELRRAFFHDSRRVRVKAAEELARQGEVAYPLVAPMLRSSDIWVRWLAMWTLTELSHGGFARLQAIQDLRELLRRESDWFLNTLGKELLRKLHDPDVESLADQPEIPNLTGPVIATLQEIVDCEREPFRKGFKVYYITVELSSLVYRRGLIGLDLDDLRIYVNSQDYFPPYYRYYKSGDLDVNGIWRGWRRLWIRGETLNLPDGPRVVEIPARESSKRPGGGQTIVLYDHLRSAGQVQLPDLHQVIEQHGLGKMKDRTRHVLLEQWDSGFRLAKRILLSRLHAAALVKMLFDLPAELLLSDAEWEILLSLADQMLLSEGQKPKRVLKLVTPDGVSLRRRRSVTECLALPLWLDVPKYSVRILRSSSAGTR